MKTETEVREELEDMDHWRGDRIARSRCASPKTRGKIRALQWVLEIDPREWDDETED